ncbi:hypothetical protein ACMYYO_11830 [Dermacoccaceae bacterium W4C1]
MPTTATRARLTGLALAAACATALTACGGNSDSDNTSAPATSEGAATSAAATSAPETSSSEAPASSESAEPSSASESSTESSATESGSSETSAAAEGDKPSKESVAAGLKKFYSTQDVPGQELLDLDKFSECMADKGYSTWSTKTLNAIADGDPSKAAAEDSSSFAKLGSECGQTSIKAGAVPTGS